MKLCLVLLIILSGCAFQSLRSGGFNPVIAFLSDFGTQDASVSICKGTILSRHPEANIVDITHEVPAFSIEDASRILHAASMAFPKGTVFLAFVDRQKNGKSKALVMKTKLGHYFVIPNSAIVNRVAERDGIEEVREISSGKWVDSKAFRSTFLARDVFAPVAAQIARGENWTEVGPVVTSFQSPPTAKTRPTERGVGGEVIAIDAPFGNLITNVTSSALLGAGYSIGDKVPLRIAGRSFTFPFVNTFSDVPIGSPLLYIDSTDALAIAVNQGNFAKKYKIRPPVPIEIVRKRG